MLLISPSAQLGSESQELRGRQRPHHSSYTTQGVLGVQRRLRRHHPHILVHGPEVVLLRRQQVMFSSTQAVTARQRISQAVAHPQCLPLYTYSTSGGYQG